jgi:predicted O-methyltransferase YrrM
MTLRRDVLGSIRYVPIHACDKQLARDVYQRHRNSFVVLPYVLSYYNWIRFEGNSMEHEPIVAEAVRRAEGIEGWMATVELEWLAQQARRSNIIVEIGSWKGRSTKALSYASRGVVYTVDHWTGCEDSANKIAGTIGADVLVGEFYRNLTDEIQSGRCVPIRSESEPASKFLADVLKDRRIDMVFIDGNHAYEAVIRDIKIWEKLLTPHGLLCGHDYSENWPGVVRAVNELFPSRKLGPGAIWSVER